MVATIQIFLDTGGSAGAPGTSTNTDPLGPPNIRFKFADDALIDANDPIPIPASGTNYSRAKSIYGKCSVAPNTQIDNFQFYTDGGNFGTGITVKVGLQFPTHNHSATTGYQPSPVNQTIVTNYSGITSAADAFSYTSGSTLVGPSISESGNKIVNVGDTTNYMVLQMEVISTASPGNLADETFTFQYDEI